MQNKLSKRIFLLTLTALAIFEVIAGEYFLLCGARMDLLLIMVVIGSIYFDAKWALFFSLFTGLLKDLFSTDIFGLNTLLLPGITFLVIKLSRKIILEHTVIRVVIIFAAALLYNLLLGILSFSRGISVPWGIFVRNTVLSPIYTAAISPLLLKAIE